MSLEVQASTLFLMVLSGTALGAVFDGYRVVFAQLRVGRYFVHAFDLLYWLAAMLFVFRILYFSNSGEVRVYVFLGLLLGISLYFALLSSSVIKGVLMTIRAIQTLFRWSIRLFTVLIVRPIRFLYKCLFIIFGFIGALSIFLFKIVIQLLYPVWKILSWVTKPLHRYFTFLSRWKEQWLRAMRWIKGRIRRTK